MKKKLWKYVFTICVSTLLYGCYPQGADTINEYDLVYTNHDANYSFKGKGTYLMPDKVVKIQGDYIAGKPLEYVNATYTTLILNQVKENMTRLGYTQVTDTSKAEIILFNSVLEVTNITYYYDYWGYYYPYGWYYPYYGGGYTTSYTTGTLSMNIVDKTLKNPTDKARVVWTGIVNGLLEGSSTDYPNRIKKTINQAFNQSSYLQQ